MAQPSPWDTGGIAGSLADAIKRQAATQAKIADEKKAQDKPGLVVDPFQQLIQQIQSINVAPTPYDQLMQQATGSAGAQFDPLIEQLRAEMSATQQRGERNQSTVKQMYGDLATDIAAEMPQITNQMAQASKETENRYNETQQQLAGQYNQQAAQQAELFKKLGIQAAAPEASQQAKEDQTYFQNQSNSDEAAARQLLQEMGNSDVSYNRQSADNTRLAGVNAASDIGAQLEEYLQVAGGKLGGLISGRQSAIQSMLSQLQQQDAQRVAQSEESEYKRLMDMFNLQLKMQEMQNDAENTVKPLFKGTNGPSGMANYLSEAYPGDDFTSRSISEAINDVMSSPEALAGEYDTGKKDMYGQTQMNKINDQYLIDMLRRRMSEGDLDPNTPAELGQTSYSDFDVNNAINALLAMMGKLK
jgi:hypothetical protein